MNNKEFQSKLNNKGQLDVVILWSVVILTLIGVCIVTYINLK